MVEDEVMTKLQSVRARALLLTGIVALTAHWGLARAAHAADPASYTRETVVAGMPFHGIHGLTFDAKGNLYVGSVVGQTTYRVDPQSGKITVDVGPPDGCADDMEFGPDGRRYWTQLFGRKVVAAMPGGGPIQVLATDRTGINSIAWKQDGRLFATEVFDGDALYEIDPKGEQPARQIAKDIGGLNGFDFGPDGKLYGPLWFKSVVARVDVDSGKIETVATGFETPAAANFDSKGRLYVLDTARGEVVNVDTKSGARKVVAKLDPGLDNLAFDPNDHLFVSNMANNGIYEVDTATGKVRTVVEGKLSVPAALDLVEEKDGREVLHVADTFAYRTVDLPGGAVKTIGRVYQGGLTNPLGVAVGATRTLVTFFMRGEGQILDRGTGKVVSKLELQTPYAAIALDGDRFLVAEMAPGRLVEVKAAGGEPRVVAEGLAQPVGLTAAGPNRVYVAEAGNGQLTAVDLESGEKKVIATGLSGPEGIDTTPAGNVVVAEVGARSISRIDPKGGAKTVLAEDLPLGLPVPAGLPPMFIPTGVAVSKTGAIYFSSDVDSAIYRLVPKR
jgi:sugar lactone lactonase YvrE